MRKIGIFLSRKIANRLRAKEINFFIFFANSKIVQACLVLSGHTLPSIIQPQRTEDRGQKMNLIIKKIALDIGT